jgi:hypothetical protein
MDWLVSNESLPLRIAVGVVILAIFAVSELRERGWRDARRWREYAFLVASVALAIAYGITNDLITSRISPEYFLFFKGAAERVSNEAAANPALHRGELDLQAIRIGTLATWSAGLIGAALLLTANSIGNWPRPSLRRLARYVALMFALAIVGAVALGIIGYRGGLTWTSGDFAEMVANDEMRPHRLMCTYGIHLGGYLGALLGLLIGIARVLIVRRRRARDAASGFDALVPLDRPTDALLEVDDR